MRRLLISVAMLLALTGAAQAARDAARDPVVAMVGRGLDWHVTRVDPVSLRPVGRSSQSVALQWAEWLLSPDGSWLAAGRNGPELRLLRLGAGRESFRVRFTRGSAHPLAWLSTRTLVAELDAVVKGAYTRTLVGIDSNSRRIVWRRSLGRATIFDSARARGRLVLLVGPYRSGPARVLVVSASGDVRSTEVDRVLAGAAADANNATFERRPGLAVDPSSDRAYVVGAGAPLAQVDLSRMTVAYRGGERSLAKIGAGMARQAVWLGNGTLAVTGADADSTTTAGGLLRYTSTPIGLYLVDVEGGSARLVKPDVSSVRLVGRSLVAFGVAEDSTVRNPAGFGLTVLGLDGSERLHLFGSTPIRDVRAQGGLVYASLPDRSGHVVVIDADAARVLANVTRPAVGLVTAR